MKLKIAVAVTMAVAPPLSAVDAASEGLQPSFEEWPEELDLRDVRPPALSTALTELKRALRAADATRVARMYETEAWLATDCQRPGRGQAAIQDVWRQRFGASAPSFSFRVESISVGDALAIENGRATFSEILGGVPFSTHYRYLRVWRRLDGEWLIAADLSEPFEGRNAGCPGPNEG